MAKKQFQHKRKPDGIISNAEFVRRMSEELHIPKHLVRKIVNAISAVTIDALEHNEGVSLPYFGSLKLVNINDTGRLFFGNKLVRTQRYKWSSTLLMNKYLVDKGIKQRKELNDT